MTQHISNTAVQYNSPETLRAMVQTAEFVPVGFEDFDRRARRGEQLTVVFFGGSLTWGANATDPQETSYRALTSQRLRAHYPLAHFRFRDAAIGGTNSQLETFRLDRDVLAYEPDLVFLDFSVNDHPYQIDAERLASYEAIVRRLVAQHVLVLQVILAVQGDLETNPEPRPLDALHRAIAHAYDCPCADVVVGMRHLVEMEQGTPERWLWPGDETHPCDEGYAAYAEIVWQTFLSAVEDRMTTHMPSQMLHAPSYLAPRRLRLDTRGTLPSGWRQDKPKRISAWYDALMSRWLDGVSVAYRSIGHSQQPAPLQVRFQGTTALLFGESTPASGKYRVLVDGEPSRFRDDHCEAGVFDAASAFGGNVHHVRVVAQDLAPSVEHVLEIQLLLELNQELRVESLCIAGI